MCKLCTEGLVNATAILATGKCFQRGVPAVVQPAGGNGKVYLQNWDLSPMPLNAPIDPCMPNMCSLSFDV